MVGSRSGPGSTFKAFLGSARVRVPLSNKLRVRVGSVQHIYGSLRVRVRILGPVKTSSLEFQSDLIEGVIHQSCSPLLPPEHSPGSMANCLLLVWDVLITEKLP